VRTVARRQSAKDNIGCRRTYHGGGRGGMSSRSKNGGSISASSSGAQRHKQSAGDHGIWHSVWHQQRGGRVSSEGWDIRRRQQASASRWFGAPLCRAPLLL